MGNNLDWFYDRLNVVLQLSGEKKISAERMNEILTAPTGRYVLGHDPNLELEQKVVNIYSAYRINNSEVFKCCVNSIMNINGELGYGIWENAGEVRKYDIQVANTVNKMVGDLDNMFEEFKALSGILDIVNGAVAYFCYIVDKVPFYHDNVETAFVCMDRILMSTRSSFIATDDQIKVLLYKIQNAYVTGNITDVYNYIRSKLITSE